MRSGTFVGVSERRGGPPVAGLCGVLTVVLLVSLGCSNDDPPNDELLRIEGPAQVDPSFDGIDRPEP